MALKRIPIQQLRVGMYYAGCDLPWISTPFWRRRFLIRSAGDIANLRGCGALEVDIDLARGADVKAPRALVAEPPVAPRPPAPDPVAADLAMAKEFAKARVVRHELLNSVQSIFDNVTSGVVQADEVRHVAHRVVSTTLAQPAAFLALSRARKFDPDLQEHALSVCTLSLFLGQALKYGPGRLEDIAHGALLHDVGLIRLPHYMLRLARRLAGHEQALYDSHPRLGAELLSKEGFHRDIIEMVEQHHATLKPHPDNSLARRPTEGAQIVGLVDRYVDLTTPQMDAPGLSGAAALTQLYQEAQGGHLDLALVSHFVQILGVYPLYSLVLLNTGERAIVTRVAPGSLHRPVVRLVTDADGNRYGTPQYIDLSEEDGAQARAIKEVLDEDKEGIRIEEVLAEGILVHS